MIMSKQKEKLRDQYKKDCQKNKLSERELEAMVKQIKSKAMGENSKQKTKGEQDKENTSYAISLKEQSRRRQIMKGAVSAAAVFVVVIGGIFAIKGGMIPGTSTPFVYESQEPEVVSSHEPANDGEENPDKEEGVWEGIVLKIKENSMYVSIMTVGAGVRQFETVDVSYDGVASVCKEGDLIKIHFNGNILETYPARIGAEKIEVVEALEDGVIPLLSMKEVNYSGGKENIDAYENSLRKASAEGDAIFINYQLPGKNLTEIDEEQAAENTKSQIARFIGDMEMNLPSYLPVVQISTKEKRVHAVQYVYDGEKIVFTEIEDFAEVDSTIKSCTSKELYVSKLEDGTTVYYISENGTIKNNKLEEVIAGNAVEEDFRVMYIEEAGQN